MPDLPSPHRRVPGTGRSFEAVALRLPGCSVLPPTAVGGATLKGTALWSWNTRGPLFPRWGYAGYWVMGSLASPEGRPELQLGDPCPGSNLLVVPAPTPGHLPEVSWPPSRVLEQGPGGAPSCGEGCRQLRNSRPGRTRWAVLPAPLASALQCWRCQALHGWPSSEGFICVASPK